MPKLTVELTPRQVKALVALVDSSSFKGSEAPFVVDLRRTLAVSLAQPSPAPSSAPINPADSTRPESLI